ncbi:kinase-like protein [Auricularia subglabra TFB-10046 SS5]|nr:kinase-like protein [Auricularia subglabra TFB-10046 SS5]
MDVTVRTNDSIGCGGMGTVFKGDALMAGKAVPVAVKLPINCDVEHVKREQCMWEGLEHRNILRLYGVCEISGPIPQIALVSPFMERGNLRDFLARAPNCNRLPLMGDCAAGLLYLHDTVKVVHGDIKMGNVLIDGDGRAVLADFGLSTTVLPGPDRSNEMRLTSYSLTYCAPELINGEAIYANNPGTKRSKTTMSDIYAFAVLIFVMDGGELPNNVLGMVQMTGEIERGCYPCRPEKSLTPLVFSDQLWPLCKACWAKDPEKRPKIASIAEKLERMNGALNASIIF